MDGAELSHPRGTHDLSAAPHDYAIQHDTQATFMRRGSAARLRTSPMS